jgi:hypothetical protein
VEVLKQQVVKYLNHPEDPIATPGALGGLSDFIAGLWLLRDANEGGVTHRRR